MDEEEGLQDIGRKRKMKTIDIEKALAEKRQMQKIFVREHGRSSSILALVIAYFEGKKEK